MNAPSTIALFRIPIVLLALTAVSCQCQRDVHFEPQPVPELPTSSEADDTPFYIFLFVHTEDHINHGPSEERYLRLAPLVAELTEENPDANLVWTIEFQGTDAKTVHERNAVTGIADMLRKYADRGVVEFGYHAHHDPTYAVRPQNDITPSSTWEQKVNAMDRWISCEKEPYLGGCLGPGGGLLAIEKHFGPVQVISGLYLYTEASIEHDASSHAVKRYLPERILGFGYPDHGAEADESGQLSALMTILSPSIETSGTLFWADNVLKINDGDRANDIKSLNTVSGLSFNLGLIDMLDRSRPHVLNAHLGSKYHYTPLGMSPTIWAYDHPDHPTLPEYLSTEEIDRNYRTSVEVLTHLVEEALPKNPGSRFVSSQDVIDMVAPPEYWVVSSEDLDVLARWVILKWGERPPNFASDGRDFYSLRDVFVLLAKALAGDFPESVELTDSYGPFDIGGTSQPASVAADDVIQLAQSIAEDILPDETWQTTPSNILASSYAVGKTQINTAQLLYAMAMIYASNIAKTPLLTVDLPAGPAMPETLAILEQLGCTDCQGTAWSLKPARIVVPVEDGN